MEVSKGNCLLRIIEFSLIFFLCIALCFTLIPVKTQAAIPFFVVGAAVVAGFLAMAGIVAETRNDDKNVFEMLYEGYTEDLDEQMKQQKMFQEEINQKIEDDLLNNRRVTPRVSIKASELKTELTDFVDYLDRVSIFDETTGKYKLTLDSGIVELSFDDLQNNAIDNIDDLPQVKGKFNIDFRDITEFDFNLLSSQSYSDWYPYDCYALPLIVGKNEGDVFGLYNQSYDSISIFDYDIQNYVENIVGFKLTRDSSLMRFASYYAFRSDRQRWSLSYANGASFTPNHLRTDGNEIQDFIYWFSTWGNRGDNYYLALNVAYQFDGVYHLKKFSNYSSNYYSPMVKSDGSFFVFDGYDNYVKWRSENIPSGKQEVTFGDFINWDNVQSIETVIDNLENEDIEIQVPINPITEDVRGNTTIRDFVQDTDFVDGLVAEGIDVDKPVIEIMPYESEFPTLALRNIWDYVIYLFNQASGFIIFISSYFAAIPELIRFSFLGGFVLLVIVGLLKRIL